MTEPTNTRTDLRRALCQTLQMPFIRRTGGQSLVAASPAPTTTSISDANLIPEDNYWNGQWWYSIVNNEVRKIIDTIRQTNIIKFEYAGTLPVAGQAYEIHSIFNALELHDAINRAIEDAFPAFFDYVTDETLILQEETLKYSVSSLTQVPWRICKVWLEHSSSRKTGTVTSAAAGTLVDTGNNFTGCTGWYVSIYKGTGAGQIRTISTLTGTTQLNLSAVWTTTPDTTSKYSVWNSNEQVMNWEQVLSVDFDSKEYPTYIYLTKPFSECYGLRIRLEYMARPLPLSIEGSTTVVPKEFIVHKALSYLFGMKVSDNRADRTRYANLEEYHRQLAEQYRSLRAFQQPDTTIWQSSRSILSAHPYGTDDPFSQ